MSAKWLRVVGITQRVTIPDASDGGSKSRVLLEKNFDDPNTRYTAFRKQKMTTGRLTLDAMSEYAAVKSLKDESLDSRIQIVVCCRNG